ncbi:VOC family protein [Microvirga sp. W0021]|uniref:VOC family protein n=1 Tax=Hohaiivirga grylli TaxID=3133970 RepID=A0ABV0BJF4_9HYPH
MFEPNLTILYVDSPAKSEAFYVNLLGRKPVESSPTFAMFAFPSGMRLAFWSRHTVEPAIENICWSGELAFPLSTRQDVDAAFAMLSNNGLKIIQQPQVMDFGYTFVALDPDGYRLRIYCPEL